MAIAFTLLVLVFLGWSIKKDFNAPVVLALCGAALFAYAHFTGVPGMVELKPDNLGLFYFEKLNAIFQNRLAGLGLLIMSAGGFSAYMTHIGAIDVLIDLALHPLKRIPSPYVVGAGVFIIGNFLQMFITSAAGLGVLLMAMAFPVMRKLGLSIRSSAGFVVMTGVSEFGPTQANAIFAAEQAKMAVLDYVIQYQAVVVGVGLLVTSVVAIFWFKFLDAKETNLEAADEVVDEVATKDKVPKAPKYYALLTLMPLALLLIFSKYTGCLLRHAPVCGDIDVRVHCDGRGVREKNHQVQGSCRRLHHLRERDGAHARCRGAHRVGRVLCARLALNEDHRHHAHCHASHRSRRRSGSDHLLVADHCGVDPDWLGQRVVLVPWEPRADDCRKDGGLNRSVGSVHATLLVDRARHVTHRGGGHRRGRDCED